MQQRVSFTQAEPIVCSDELPLIGPSPSSFSLRSRTIMKYV